MLVDGEQIFYIIPRLYEHRQDAVGLVARLRRHAQRHLTLNHARAAGYEILIIEHLEEDL